MIVHERHIYNQGTTATQAADIIFLLQLNTDAKTRRLFKRND